MRADNLKRHVKSRHLKKSCAAPLSLEENKLAEKNRSAVSDDADIAAATPDGVKLGFGKFETIDNNQSSLNPKIQKLMNELPSSSKRRRTKADIIGYNSDVSDTDEDDNNTTRVQSSRQ